MNTICELICLVFALLLLVLAPVAFSEEPEFTGPYYPIEFESYCQTQDCLDRTYDIYVDTGRDPVTDWELSEIHRNEWLQAFGPNYDFDPLFEAPEWYNPRPITVYCEYGLGCVQR